MSPWLDANVSAYDIVHIHGLFSHVNGLAGRICRRRSVPYVVTPHGMANRYGMRHKPVRKAVSLALVERPLLEGAAAVHMTSRREERDFADLGIKAPVRRIPLAVAPVRLGDAAKFRSRHPEIGDRRLAVFVGRLNPIKNLEAAIDALALSGGADLRLVVCGDGPDDYVGTLKARAAERGVAERVSWLGYVSNEDKADVLAAADIYVQPSLSESFGMAAVEAVSVGLPCVLGENVAIAEDLVAAGFAFAVPPTAEAIVGGIRKATLNMREQSDYAARARAFVTSSFGAVSVGADLLSLYELASASVSKDNL
jgi:glycosyltransferase involved in cell wall biosynthesis